MACAATKRRLAVLVAAVLVVVLACSTETAEPSLEAGPLMVPLVHGWSYRTEVGIAFTDGLEILAVSGDEAAIIDGVSFEGDPALELVGALIAPPPRPVSSTQVVKRWPPVQRCCVKPETLIEAVGAQIGPGQGARGQAWELMLGIRVTEAGRHHRTGVVIDYHVGDTSYRTTFPAELEVCAVRSYEKDKCAMLGSGRS